MDSEILEKPVLINHLINTKSVIDKVYTKQCNLNLLDRKKMRGRWFWNGLVDKTCPYSSEMWLSKKLHTTDLILSGRKVVCLGDSTFRDISVSTFRL